MPDKSFLDERYFVDERSYNCPFCNRRHVSYTIYMFETFDWGENKPCHVYFARCQSCGKRSMHLSHHSIKVSRFGYRKYGVSIWRASRRLWTPFSSILFHRHFLFSTSAFLEFCANCSPRRRVA